jgi:spore germination protein KC
MDKRKTVCKWFIVFSTLFILTGCWDRKEVEERAYVIGLGLDKSETEDKLKVTFLIENPEVGSAIAGVSTTEPAQELVQVEANDFITAKTTANAIISRDITYDLLRIIVVSEKLAKDENLIRWMYDALKDREIRRDTYLAVSNEDAFKFFKNNKPKMETRPHKYYQFMINRGIDGGIIPDSDLHRFFKTTETDENLFLAMNITTEQSEDPAIKNEDEYTAGEVKAKGTAGTTQFVGSAVFKEGIMVGKITGQETRINNVLDDTTEMKDLLATWPDPFSDKHSISGRLIKEKDNKFTVNVKGEKTKMTIEVPLIVDILSDPSLADYAESPRNRKILRETIQKQLQSMYNKYVKKTQTELKGATFPISLEARKKFATVEEWHNYNWMKKYPEADIEVKVTLEIKEFGKQVKVKPLKELRD